MAAPESVSSAIEPTSDITIAVVTASWNRRDLLANLHGSLMLQTDPDFVWLVMDDASTDGTPEWLTEVEAIDDRVRSERNLRNRGKCASLNTLFRLGGADFYLVVDSDDTLHPEAIETVKDYASRYALNPSVGAIFFGYGGTEEDRLRSTRPFPDGLVCSRSKFNELYGKFDGCVGYFRRAVEKFQYPEYPGETYVGPTVLQLMMHPQFEICFTAAEVGLAQYQVGGLTAAGRSLRIANPLGMMDYTRLQAEQADVLSVRFVNALLYYAYSARTSQSVRAARGLAVGRGVSAVSKVLGRAVSFYWRWRYKA